MSGHFTKYYVVRTTIRGQEALANEDAGAYEPIYLSSPVDAYIEALAAHAGEPQAGGREFWLTQSGMHLGSQCWSVSDTPQKEYQNGLPRQIVVHVREVLP